MGGGVRRQRKSRSIFRKSDFGVSLQHRSNSFYPKFLTETSRSAPPPCRETARLAEKLPLLILICARHQKILLKGKGNFSARLCPQPFGQGGGASLPARARRPRNYLAPLGVRGKNSPKTYPLEFTPHNPEGICAGPRPRFGGEKFLRRYAFPCPTLPARKRLRNSLY
jgi:hypothetical protein